MKRTRSHETSLTIDAPIDEVWKAITEAQELQRWLAAHMKVTPGVGGEYVAGWGPGLDWNMVVEVWEPSRHLRLVQDMTKSAETLRIVQDYYLEAQGGQTLVRMVHSGFGSAEAWDSEYEGTRGGWPGVLLRLKIGLERHRGESTHNILLSAKTDGLTVPDALKRAEALLPPADEEVFRTEGNVSKVLTGLNHSLLTISVQPGKSGAIVYFEALLFGQTDGVASAFESEWRERLNFGSPV